LAEVTQGLFAMPDPLSITVYSDVVCPWCYVGKRRLEAALKTAGARWTPRLAWRPFELNPDMPAEGMDRQSYRARKLGAARSAALDRAMLETGREVGIAFAFDRMPKTPNTRLAHRLIWHAGQASRQDALVERLFRGYFEEGLDIGAPDVLTRLGDECGLSPSEVENALSAPESLDAVIALEREGLSLGIAGVPFFIIGARYAVSGAQPAAFWSAALERLAASREGSEAAPP
jgi:predicted DsbA family dithiol-disulfide isomerase